jgi:hypothetical protein
VGDQPKPLFEQGGAVFIPASQGEVYQIRLYNRSPQRVAVALYIDGLNTIGMKRELPSAGKKWVLNPNQTATVRGWQVDANKAREFTFVGFTESVAARQRFTDQIGLITAPFYPEAAARPRAARTRARIGTGAGQEVASAVKQVVFRSAASPAAILTVHYDAADVVGKYKRIGN